MVDEINQLNIPVHLKTEPVQTLRQVAKTETYLLQLGRFVDRILGKQTEQTAYVIRNRYQVIVEREKNTTHVYTKDQVTGWINHVAFKENQMIENERFITRSEVEKRLEEIGKTVYVVDEVNMVKIKNVVNLLEKIISQNGKVIAIGDVKQFLALVP
ncbi:AAA family ATPase [Caldisericum sp.]|uniref:AAA family ATPase n=1 Tax=Caldisericum sp. TaxID=2499687 RepID=UPI003D13E8C3